MVCSPTSLMLKIPCLEDKCLYIHAIECFDFAELASMNWMSYLAAHLSMNLTVQHLQHLQGSTISITTTSSH